MSQQPGVLIHKDYFNDHLVEIRDSGDYRTLYFPTGTVQSRISLSNPHRLVLRYTRYMLLALLIQPEPENILIIGIGSGSFVRFFHHHFPRCHIDAVDYSKHIINMARGYFQLPENSKIIVHCDDGYRFLKNYSDIPYDIILIDAFDDQGMAPTIYSDQFFRLCADNLSQNGVVSCNIWSNDKTQLQQIKTLLATHFADQLFLPVPDRGNRIILSLPDLVHWPDICLKKKKLKQLGGQFNLNFKEIVRVARQNNMSLAKRIGSLMS